MKNLYRKGCKDVFNSFLVSTANYDSEYEIPVIKPIYIAPESVIEFSKAISSKEYNRWVHFYEDDHLFERIWRNPRRYLPILKKFKGVILPDFSLYRDMPLCMQIWNIYRSRAIGNWLQKNGVLVIPNVRWGDYRTHKISIAGLSKHGTISIGALGCIKDKDNRNVFIDGFNYAIRELTPNILIIYGSIPDYLLKEYNSLGINVVIFPSSISLSHKEVV